VFIGFHSKVHFVWTSAFLKHEMNQTVMQESRCHCVCTRSYFSQRPRCGELKHFELKGQWPCSFPGHMNSRAKIGCIKTSSGCSSLTALKTSTSSLRPLCFPQSTRSSVVSPACLLTSIDSHYCKHNKPPCFSASLSHSTPLFPVFSASSQVLSSRTRAPGSLSQ
jgi:hypothetical protein